jgi:hypothetical protein
LGHVDGGLIGQAIHSASSSLRRPHSRAAA